LLSAAAEGFRAGRGRRVAPGSGGRCRGSFVPPKIREKNLFDNRNFCYSADCQKMREGSGRAVAEEGDFPPEIRKKPREIEGRRREKIWNRAQKLFLPDNPLISHKTAKGIFGNTCQKK
jgi:hypothetical protein